MRKERFSKKKPQEKGDTEKRDQIDKEMLKQMKAKSDENRMKGKEDERKGATEKHKYNFLRIEQESDQNGRFQKEEMKIENENGETEEMKTLGKTSTMIYFSRIKWCQKKEEIQNLDAKQV